MKILFSAGQINLMSLLTSHGQLVNAVSLVMGRVLILFRDWLSCIFYGFI
jgi:hypothetical protein